MALYLSLGSPTTELSSTQLRDALRGVLDQLGQRKRVIAVPPDYSRFASRAGELTCMALEYYGDRLVDVLPAVGTHEEMSLKHRQKMFPTVPAALFRYHNWRTDVETVGMVPGEYCAEVTDGIYRDPWPAQTNRLISRGGHDLILSIGQVVPHEVIGMANYNKNIFVGAGGVRGINESHYIGAVYGMERIMGVGDTPLRRILNYAQDHFCRHLPLVYVLTVIGPNEAGQAVVRGLFAGDDAECFWRACELAFQVNVTVVDEPFQRCVVYLDPEKFPSTWLGNKAIYRTRMAMADGGELVILAPGVRMFGEDSQIDQLIRKYGYLTTPEVLAAVDANDDLRGNLSAAAHLIHGSSEDRFRVTYCPGGLSRDEIVRAKYQFGELAQYAKRYDVGALRDGWNTLADGERFFFVRDPAMGLWKRRTTS
ncbi:MAG TPA: D-mannonate epimerase [Lacipirellulaceae bacterium]|nr:D-mannonate epimerase [Lacipirellulaceae bacterium]HMP06320.1 D-mannonate epimerase [Lacipirellulaceae bacterium]